MMKNIIKTAAIVIGLGSVSAFAITASQAANLEVAEAMEQTATFAIDKMTCAMCPITVRTAMSKVDGVSSVKTDFEKKTAVVVFDPSKASLETIAAASTNAGYPATLAKKESK